MTFNGLQSTASSRVLSARFSADQAEEIEAAAEEAGTTPSALIRRSVEVSTPHLRAAVEALRNGDLEAALICARGALPAAADDPVTNLADVLAALGVAGDTTEDDALEALRQLYAAAEDAPPAPAPDGTATSETPDTAAPVMLSAAQRAALQKRGLPVTAAAWRTLLDNSVRRSTSGPARAATPNPKPVGLKPAKLTATELVECKKRGIDPADYAARKARAVRRITP